MVSQARRPGWRWAGFTLVELVVVMVVLAVLAAVGLARFARTDGAAVAAQVEGLAGGLQTAVTSFHANWRLNPDATVNVPGWGDGTLDANSDGWPAGGRRDAAAVGRDRDCEDLWRGLLGHAPTVMEADPNKEAGTSFNHIEPKIGTEVRWVAGQDASIPDATTPLPPDTPHAEICQFISLHYQSVAPGTPKPTIFYDSRSGQVWVDLDRVF
jgi:prepilin-type N-terminal cleavage/methylation domain-containing protein